MANKTFTDMDFSSIVESLQNGTLDDNNSFVIVSQIRDNVQIGSFEKYTRAGGKALDFYSSLITWLATAKKITVKDGDKDVPIGGTNKIKVTKGKVPRPFREGFYTRKNAENFVLGNSCKNFRKFCNEMRFCTRKFLKIFWKIL